jgi:two-component system sensor histidine kinase HydH
MERDGQNTLDKIRILEGEKQAIAKEYASQQKELETLERKLAKFDEIKEQRDWLLDEMTKKINELSHFQSELFKAARFSAIGEMSARLAHDMRNPLAIIKNTVELVKLKHSSSISEELLQLFGSIDDASSRLAFQLDEVLNFVRVSPLNCTKCSLREIMNSAINKLIIPDQIRIHKPFNDVHLFCDIEKITTVFTNLIMNAVQAMDNSGSITIRFDETHSMVTIKVQDTGPGIPESLLDKVFEPLFTTKFRGTGLGLQAVKNIIQQHQGTISVTNRPTVFSVSLPKNMRAKS